MFNEICIYEAKLTKLDEIEELMREVAEFYLKQDGVIDVHYIKPVSYTHLDVYKRQSYNKLE